MWQVQAGGFLYTLTLIILALVFLNLFPIFNAIFQLAFDVSVASSARSDRGYRLKPKNKSKIEGARKRLREKNKYIYNYAVGGKTLRAEQFESDVAYLEKIDKKKAEKLRKQLLRRGYEDAKPSNEEEAQKETKRDLRSDLTAAGISFEGSASAMGERPGGAIESFLRKYIAPKPSNLSSTDSEHSSEESRLLER
jgi:hypothetical protein